MSWIFDDSIQATAANSIYCRRMIVLVPKHILLGITGGIAAYKCAELVRLLTQAGAVVRVVMTEGASAFITPLTLQTLSGHKVYQQHLHCESEAEMSHIALARWADLVLIAPATANCIAKLAAGFADDLLTTLCLATAAPIILAPAMNTQMWFNAATQANIDLLRTRNINCIGPAAGIQACGETGPGRMVEPEEIVNYLEPLFKNTQRLAGKHLVVTAGPTQEAIDPVRYLSNYSSGKMGHAIAEAAALAGAKVTLISGPTVLQCPRGVDKVDVVTAQQMFAAVMACASTCDFFIAAAAVADYRVANISMRKIKKSADALQLELVANPDI